MWIGKYTLVCMKKNWQKFCILFLCFLLFTRYYTIELPQAPAVHTPVQIRTTAGNIFSKNFQTEEVTAEDVKPELRDICFIREKVLGCRLDKLCRAFSSKDCGLVISDIVQDYKPKQIKFASGDLDYPSAGRIIDNFLGPHSTWTVSSEPYPGLPQIPFHLQKMESASIATKLYQTLDKQQYPLNCNRIWPEKFMNTGLGFCLASLSYGITVGMETSNTFVAGIGEGEKWPYWEKCDRADWTCFFLPYTNCTTPPSTLFKNNKDDLKIIAHEEVPEPFKSLLQNTGIPNPTLWWRMHVTQYLIRKNYQTRQRISEMERELQNSTEFQFRTPCLLMHVRHGDIWTEPTRRKYFSLSEYMEKAKPLLNMIDSKNIFLIFDDEEIVDEIPNFPEFHFFYLPRKRHRGKSPPFHMFEGDSDVEMYWIMILLKMSSYCGAFVGTFSSNFSALVYQSMCYYGEGSCPLYDSLDDPDWHVQY